MNNRNLKTFKVDLATTEPEWTAADADKGGHRDKALSDVNAAITQVNAGIAYAAANK